MTNYHMTEIDRYLAQVVNVTDGLMAQRDTVTEQVFNAAVLTSLTVLADMAEALLLADPDFALLNPVESLIDQAMELCNQFLA